MYNPKFRLGWNASDPLAEKYYPISPYAFCAGNPINNIDWNGQEVIALTYAAQRAILNTLPRDLQKHVVFNPNGTINKVLLNSTKSNSGNYVALSSLVYDKRIYEVIVTDKIVYKDENGTLNEKGLGDITQTNNYVGSFGFNTGEDGWQGVTQTPGDAPRKYNSPDENVKIVINSNLSEKGQAQTFAHEGYGHSYLYSKGIVHTHQYINTAFGFKEGNQVLSEAIRQAIKETITNMNNKPKESWEKW